jgi:hypothetical protein
MQRYSRLFSAFRSTAAVALFAGVATFGLQAQQSSSAAATRSLSPYAQPVAVDSPTFLASVATNEAPFAALDHSSLNYSSSAGAAETTAAEGMSFGGDASPQPPPRRYGRRPVYADSAHNADGSNKYGFYAGAGFTVPVGGTANYLSPSYSIQVGGGRNFNKTLGLMVEFDWDNFGIQGSTLNKQYTLYNSLGAGLASLDGYNHQWSFSLDPTYTFWQTEQHGAYAIGGVGFYHKITTFTTPALGLYCSPFYGCFQYQANQPIDSYTSNAAGLNIGLGYTYKPSRFGNAKLYAEARYVYTFNSQRAFDVSGATPYFNAFPQNSARTSYIPVKFGIRF